tara:strand:- start:2148 stop:2618 length:471 start_codon:yes stop_codon:yes gene_type:complete
MNIKQRKNWVSLLTAVDSQQLYQVTEQLSSEFDVSYKALPQSGLGMLKLRDGALHEPFYLGEIPISSAWVELTLANGDKAEGAAQVMDDSHQLAEALAVCDAVLANQLPGYQQLVSLLEQAAQKIEQQRRHRKQFMQRTQVDFSLLDATGGSDDKN